MHVRACAGSYTAEDLAPPPSAPAAAGTGTGISFVEGATDDVVADAVPINDNDGYGEGSGGGVTCGGVMQQPEVNDEW